MVKRLLKFIFCIDTSIDYIYCPWCWRRYPLQDAVAPDHICPYCHRDNDPND